MSELFSAVTSELYDRATCVARYYVEKLEINPCDLWRYLGAIIDEARKEYRKRFVDWFQSRHVEQAQRELAEAIIADLWEVD